MLKTENPSNWSDFDRLWLELSRAIHNFPPGESILERLGTPPWESKDLAVIEAWNKITDPKNREELERRLRKNLNPIAEAYTRKALEICLRRSEEQGGK